MLEAAAYILIMLSLSSPPIEQESRAGVIAQQQAEKAAKIQSELPSKTERIFQAAKRELVDSPSGIYPLFGSVYAGGGLALGAGYRRYYGDRTFWDAKGLWSIRNYKRAELSTDSQGLVGGRLDLNAHLGWLDATQVGYYGLGMASSADDRANFRFKETYGGASLKARPVRWAVLAAGVDYEDYKVGKGLGIHPSIETVYTASTAPALGVSPTYLHSSGSAGIDWRPSAGYARRGGLYELRYHNYRDRQETYTFDRVEAEVVQHIPILRETWVISLRSRADSTLDDADKQPFFLLPFLGGSDTLRGYSARRFRDRHSLLLQGEFRWTPNRRGLDMVLFFDAGKVASRRRDLDLRGLKKDAGIEARFHGPGVTPLRLGLARGSEGWHLVFGGSAAF